MFTRAMTPPPRSKAKLTVGAILLLVAAFSLVYYHGKLAEYVFAALTGAVVYWRSRITREHTFHLLLLFTCLVLSVVATQLSISDGVMFSGWQLIRSSVWIYACFLLLILAGSFFSRLSSNRLEMIYRVARLACLLACVGVVLEYLTGVELAPAVIRAGEDESTPRLYVVGSVATLPLLLIALHKRDWLLTLAVAIICMATQGKVMITLALVVVIVYFVSTGYVRLLPIVVITAVAGALLIYDRIEEFSVQGDSIRALQMEDALAAVRGSYSTMLLGIGHGTEYSEGFYQFGLADDELALFENSKFEIENLPGYLLLRFGLIGSLLLLPILFRSHQDRIVRRVFIACVVIYGLGGTLFATPGGILFTAGFAFAEAYRSRAQSLQAAAFAKTAVAGH